MPPRTRSWTVHADAAAIELWWENVRASTLFIVARNALFARLRAERRDGPPLDGIPAGTVKSRLFRARELVRERLTAIDKGEVPLEETMSRLEDWANAVRQSRST